MFNQVFDEAQDRIVWTLPTQNLNREKIPACIAVDYFDFTSSSSLIRGPLSYDEQDHQVCIASGPISHIPIGT